MVEKVNRKVKLGLVLSSVPPYSETFFHSKINGLAKKGFEITLFARGEKNNTLACTLVRPFPVPGISILKMAFAMVVVPYIFLISPLRVIRFWRLEKKDGIGVGFIMRKLYLNAHILTRNLDWLHFGFVTIAIDREHVAKAIGAKMGVSLRGYDVNVYPIGKPGCYEHVWKCVDQVHSISKYLIQQAYKLGLPTDKPFQIITPALEAPEYYKNNFEPGDPVQLVTVARLTWIKGLSYGIQAIAKLKEKGERVRYVIVGDGPEQKELQTEVESLGLQNEVIFKGMLSHRETLDQIKSSDIYVQPSINEGFCNAVLEAQSIQGLCIASDAGALPENICNNETGWLVRPQDPVALADKIQYVLQLSHEQKEAIATNARQRVLKKFSMEQHLNSWKIFYFMEG
jgi:colanic acid/amylovoran biosynthesis glycosyltransferase